MRADRLLATRDSFRLLSSCARSQKKAARSRAHLSRTRSISRARANSSACKLARRNESLRERKRAPAGGARHKFRAPLGRPVLCNHHKSIKTPRQEAASWRTCAALINRRSQTTRPSQQDAASSQAPGAFSRSRILILRCRDSSLPVVLFCLSSGGASQLRNPRNFQV